MRLLRTAFEYRRLVLAAAGLLTLIGTLAWLTMDRQEDPSFPYRYGQLVVEYPGADPEQIERLVLNALEEELIQVEEVNEIRGIARLGVAVVVVGMHQHVYDTDTVWERIRVAAGRAEQKFPDGVGEIRIRDRFMDTHGIVLAVTGSDDLLELLEGARQLRRDLFRVGGIARVELLADPGEQLTLRLHESAARQAGLEVGAIAAQLAERNLTTPGGTLRVGERSLVLQPRTEFGDLAELGATPIRTADGGQLALSALAAISLEPADPPTERMWWNGEPAVAVGIVLPENRLNVVRLGHEIRETVAALEADYAPLQIREMFYQPRWVEDRLGELGRSLLIGVVLVAVLLLAVMGLRLGLTVATILPLVTLSALAVYAMGGGVLHQMAIAGMVIALGMLVDNAIVMVENIQWHLDQGETRGRAITRAVAELAAPLAAATGTTLAAFAPLLLSRGDTADFTRGIPIMVMLVLLVSYIYAMFVTPVTAGITLRARADNGAGRMMRLGRRVGGFAVRRPVWVLGAAAVLLLGAGLLAERLDRDFFPDVDRNQMLVDLYFPEGTHLEHTALAASALTEDLTAHPRITDIHHFAGSTGPRFFYNLMDTPGAPHRARLVLISERESDLAPLMRWIETLARERIPDAQVVPRRLSQGPVVDAPVELRVFSEDRDALARTAEQVMQVLAGTEGARAVRHQLSQGLPALAWEIDDAAAARHGLSRQAIAEAMIAATHGMHFSDWRAGREPVPMRLRSPEGPRLDVAALEGLTLASSNGGRVALAHLVHPRTELQPAVIHHRDLRRMTSVTAETAPGHTYAQVLDRALPRLAELDLPPGTELVVGGSAEEAGDANTAVFESLPIGVLLVVAILLLQFNSFRAVAMVAITVPLAAVGVIPGLLLAGQPFSFTAILGVVALAGIVLNNAIVLLALIRAYIAAGIGTEQAIVDAVARRARPILLTTATTIAGLLPLTFTRSTLWPPMAWAIISGLTASTLLTLLVVPALYRLLMRPQPSSA